jgi:S1-C subfamily serine protease
LTNSHVVFGRRSIYVTFEKGETLPATLIGADPILDIAVLKINAPDKKFSTADMLDDKNSVQVGEDVMAIGSPEGFEHTLTSGIVSGINRILPSFPMSMMVPMIQTDVSISSGNSGGPLINRCGEVIGMVTSVLNGETNLGFAIPIGTVKQIVPKLIKDGRIKRPWLGVHGKLVSQNDILSLFKLKMADGFLIETVEPGSPAEKAGLRGGLIPIKIAEEEFLFGGDIITEVNGKLLDNPKNFEDFVRLMEIGDKVQIKYFREGEMHNVELTLPERPTLPWDLPKEDRNLLTPDQNN